MKKTSWVILILYMAINLGYYRSFWHELIYDTSTVEARYGEVLATEWGIEQSYRNIMAGKNPFAWRDSAFYPFGTEFASTDSGNALYFVLLRPWLSTHQAMSVTVAVSIYAASVGMYLLLRKLKMSEGIAGILGLGFAYTTFLLPRMGHLTYMSTYVFPWFFLSALTLIGREKKGRREWGAVGAAFFLAMALYHNLYYFVTLGLAVGLLGSYYLLFRRKESVRMIARNWRIVGVGTLFLGILLMPWLLTLRQVALFSGLPKTEGWAGAIQFSADLFGMFIPSYYSRYGRGVAVWADQHLAFAKGIFENYTYPGVMILTTIAVWGYLTLKKRMPVRVQTRVAPWMFAGFWLWSLTLGPFLHVLGKWTLELQEGIKLVVPLPFALFHYLPFMGNIRSPGRLAIGYIFVAYIAIAYLWQAGSKRLTQMGRWAALLCLAAIFYLDHSIKYTLATPTLLPNAIYDYIARDPGRGAVQEIPGAIRDGFVYFGNTDRLNFIAGQLKHQKPMVAGYSGRVPSYKFTYYQQNAWLGYVGRQIDLQVRENGGLDRTDLPDWQTINASEAARAVDFLEIKHIILYPDASHSAQIRDDLTYLGYTQIMTEQATELWKRELTDREYLRVAIGAQGDELMLGGNWYGRDQGFRWMNKSAQLLFKIAEPRALSLNLTGASFYRPQTIEVYVNRQPAGTIKLAAQRGNFTQTVPAKFWQPGVNIVHLVAQEAWQPTSVDPASSDTNWLSAQFSEAYLE